MSRSDRDSARAPGLPARHLAGEFAETAGLALPMALTQLGQIAMTTTDLAMIGHLGREAVAGAALAGTIYFGGFTVGMGLMAAVPALAAQAFGASNRAQVRRSLHAGLLVALVVSLPIMVFPLCGEKFLLVLGQAPHVSRLAQHYLFGLAFGVAPALWFLALRSFMGAVNRPQPVLWITLATIPVNALLVYLLTYGRLGLPRLELFGAGLATSLVNFLSFLAALWWATRRPPFRDYRILRHLSHIDWPLALRLVTIGAPVSIAFLLEYGMFSAASLLMGLIGITALAAHQIALQVTAILFMIPFGISMAATVRVGQAVGRNDAPGVRRAGFVALLLGIVIAAMLTLAVITMRFSIAAFFLGGTGTNGDATTELAGSLLVVGATFFVTDAIQSIAAGSLRGLEDTRVPLLFAGLGYWLVGFTSSFLLAFRMGLGATGVWIGLSIGTAVYAALLVLRFRRLSEQARLAFSI